MNWYIGILGDSWAPCSWCYRTKASSWEEAYINVAIAWHYDLSTDEVFDNSVDTWGLADFQKYFNDEHMYIDVMEFDNMMEV